VIFIATNSMEMVYTYSLVVIATKVNFKMVLKMALGDIIISMVTNTKENGCMTKNMEKGSTIISLAVNSI